MGTRKIGWITLMILVMFSAAGVLQADDPKARMLERLPVLVDLKARGVIGENNQGFLEMLQGQTEKQEVVQAENQDRRIVYEQIARQTNTGVQVVGQRRAIQIAERAGPGEWLQDGNGNWYQK